MFLQSNKVLCKVFGNSYIYIWTSKLLDRTRKDTHQKIITESSSAHLLLVLTRQLFYSLKCSMECRVNRILCHSTWTREITALCSTSTQLIWAFLLIARSGILTKNCHSGRAWSHILLATLDYHLQENCQQNFSFKDYVWVCWSTPTLYFWYAWTLTGRFGSSSANAS